LINYGSLGIASTPSRIKSERSNLSSRKRIPLISNSASHSDQGSYSSSMDITIIPNPINTNDNNNNNNNFKI